MTESCKLYLKCDGQVIITKPSHTINKTFGQNNCNCEFCSGCCPVIRDYKTSSGMER